MIKIFWERWIFLILSLFIVIMDQLSKNLIVHFLAKGQIIRVLDGTLLWIQHIYNPGMAFGIRIFPPVFLAIVSFVAIVGMIIFLFTSTSMSKGFAIPLACILGGAVGNFIDRIVLGEVLDFISVDFPDFIFHRFPTFNVADSAVSIGVVLLLRFSIFNNPDKAIDPINSESDEHPES